MGGMNCAGTQAAQADPITVWISSVTRIIGTSWPWGSRLHLSGVVEVAVTSGIGHTPRESPDMTGGSAMRQGDPVGATWSAKYYRQSLAGNGTG